MNLAEAYPAQAHLAFWYRTLRLDRVANTVEVTDEYRLKQPAGVITLTLMTPCAAQVSGTGIISLPMASGGPVRVAFDAHVFQVNLEKIPIDDPQLRHSWGDRLYRVLLCANAPPLQSKWTLQLTREE